MKISISLLLSLFGFLAIAAPQNDQVGENDSLQKIEEISLSDVVLDDDPYAVNLDSLLNFTFFIAQPAGNDTVVLEVNSEEDTASVIPEFSDSTYRARIQKLDQLSPIDLDYNRYVKAYIDVYSKRKREQVNRMLGLSEYYFPMFEEALDRHGLPLELKYLAVVESALNPSARSWVGATGLWQFMYATGRMQGLKVSSYVDERNDPLKATDAACDYLKKLHGIFGDWNLALAAYNSGPGNVSKAIRRSGGQRSYWAIRPYLPRETAGYVPAFIAVNYIMNHTEEHGLHPAEIKPSYFEVDTVTIKERLSFDQLAELLDIAEEEIAFFNPAYKNYIIPKREDDPYRIILPRNKVGRFVANEDSIYTLARQDFEKNKPALEPVVKMDDKIYHRVERGEVLGLIAEKYGVSVSSLRRWNGIRGNTIRIGQRLAVYPRKLPKSNSTTSSSQVTKPPSGKYDIYRVRSGESFYSIARKYPGVSAQNIMSWNNIKSAKSLKAGMKLKIYPNS